MSRIPKFVLLLGGRGDARGALTAQRPQGPLQTRAVVRRPALAQHRAELRRTIDRGSRQRVPINERFGATGGGLWKTTDGVHVAVCHRRTDSASSVGAPSPCAVNPDIVYIGTGESDIAAISFGWRRFSPSMPARPDGDRPHTEAFRRSASPGESRHRHVAAPAITPPNPDRGVSIEGRRQDVAEDPVPRRQDRRDRL